MAFLGKLGNILKQAASSTQIAADSLASRPSFYQAIRCMSSSKVFVGGISYSTDDTSLKEAFEKYGQVIEARVIMDRETGRSRGFGFVTYTSAEEASSAIQGLDGETLHGRQVRVNYAADRNRSYGGGGGFGGGGGYGGSSGGYGGGGYGGGGYGGSGGGGYGGSGGGGYGGSGGGSYGGGSYGGGGYGGGGDSGYGGGNPSGGFGGVPASGGFGGDLASGGFGGDPASGGFGGDPAASSYDSAASADDFGAASGNGDEVDRGDNKGYA